MDDRVKSVVSFLDQESHRSVRLAELAARVGLSPSRLSHLFRDETGTPIRAYLLDLRLGRAQRLLLDTNERISQIAYRCGFTDLSNFNHAFKRKFGSAPRRYRRRGGRSPPEAPYERYALNAVMVFRPVQ
jgi:AraC-like DNA-binding protein